MTTTSQTTDPFFQNFSGGDSVIMVASKYGGEFCVQKDTAIPKGMVEVLSSVGAGSDASDWNYAAEDWLTAPAFKKTGSKRLVMNGKSTYKCATDVAEGNLRLSSGTSPGVLPTNGVLRVTGGTLDLGGHTQTVRALLGTAGAVTNGTLVAKEGIYPGGVGAVGFFACGATLEGELHIDVDASGACDQIVARGTLDVSNIDLVLPASLPEGVVGLQVVVGATTGAFRSVANMPSGWEIVAKDTGIWAKKPLGLYIIVH